MAKSMTMGIRTTTRTTTITITSRAIIITTATPIRMPGRAWPTA